MPLRIPQNIAVMRVKRVLKLLPCFKVFDSSVAIESDAGKMPEEPEIGVQSKLAKGRIVECKWIRPIWISFRRTDIHIKNCYLLSFVRNALPNTGVYAFAGLLVFLFVFPNDISKTDAAGIIRLGTDMVHHESCKFIYVGGQRSTVKVTSS